MVSSFQFLNSAFSNLKAVGDYFEKCLSNLAFGDKIFDLLLVFPLRSQKILFCPKIFDLTDGQLVILKLKVGSYFEPKNSRQPHRFECFNESGYVDLTFFKIFPSQSEKLEINKEIAVLGTIKRDVSGRAQIIHPEFLLESEKINELPRIDLNYPLSGKLTQKFVRSKIKEIIKFLDKNYDEKKAQNNDWIDEKLIKQRNWPLFLKALKAIHNFNGEYENEDHNIIQKAKERLKYDEFLAWQIAMNFVRIREEKFKLKPEIKQNLADEFLQKLPFEPTNAQVKAIEEIKNNILSNKTMSRLLQGDVGSGKTLVAIYSCLLAVSQNKQSCVIVPISILADQHLSYFKDLLSDISFNKNDEKQKINIEILTGKTKKKKRDEILKNLKNGQIDILISTHAVLQPDVEFQNLSLVVIDEQHRFGVKQRLSLIEKGENIDVLLMSATPIPRSLTMAFFGDMDISILDEKPKNRQEIESLVLSEKKIKSIYDGIRKAMNRGEKIYWICPLIEKNEEESEDVKITDEIELTAAKDKFEDLKKIFGAEKVSLIHGKMKESEKEKIMAEFKESSIANDLNEDEIVENIAKEVEKPELNESKAKSSKLKTIAKKIKTTAKTPQILVATTVIEVGVDVKEATMIVIENSENFGLSQLHQLRGRVGRNDKKSYCILLYGKRFGKKAKERLDIMRKSSDGFFIAEEDLKMRGSGELIGTKQSGDVNFKVANLETDVDLLKIASQNAKFILNEDPTLTKKKSLKYHALLKLFSYDECVKLIKI